MATPHPIDAAIARTSMQAAGDEQGVTVSPDERTRSLTARAARGDADAVGTLYDQWFEQTLNTAHRMTKRDEAFCLDVVQETMIRLIKSRRVFGGERELCAWLSLTVRSAAIDLPPKGIATTPPHRTLAPPADLR